MCIQRRYKPIMKETVGDYIRKSMYVCVCVRVKCVYACACLCLPAPL